MLINIDLPEQGDTISTDLYIKALKVNSNFLTYINNYININFTNKNVGIVAKTHVLTQLYAICLQLSIINNTNTKAEDILHMLDMLGTNIFVFYSPDTPKTHDDYLEIVDKSKYLVDLLLSDNLITAEQARTVESSINEILSKYNSSILIV